MTRNTTLYWAGRQRWLGVPLLTTAILLALAVPAAAATNLQGSGTGTGYSDIHETGAPTTNPCLKVSSGAQYIITVPKGVVRAEDTTQTDTTSVYEGELTVTITLKEAHYISPHGTYENTSTQDCSGEPDAISAAITVTGSSGVGSVDCPTNDGTWRRVNTTVTFDGNGAGSCTITGNVDPGTSTVSSVEHGFEGNEYPCLTDPVTMTSTCPDPLDDVHVQGEWTATASNP